MKFSAVHKTFREALACHQLYRILGFTSDDIFFNLNPDSSVSMVLATQGITFGFMVGRSPFNNKDELLAEWASLCTAIQDGVFPAEELADNYAKSQTFALKVDICFHIVAK